MFFVIESAAKKLTVACMVREVYLVNWLATLFNYM